MICSCPCRRSVWLLSGALSLLPSLAGCGRRDGVAVPRPVAQQTRGLQAPAYASRGEVGQSRPVIAEPAPVRTAAGQAVPQWARGTTLTEVTVPAGQKVVALTFDDGPWPGSTRRILAILRRYDVHATFFMLGSQVRERPALAREVQAAGHVVGNHSWSHPVRTRTPLLELDQTNAEIRKALGVSPVLFRPPYGILKNGMAAAAKREGDVVLLWSADSVDWRRPGAGRIAARVLRQTGPGGIVLMHDGGGDRRQTAAALPTVIERLRQRGYRFVTVPELLSLGQEHAARAGRVKRGTGKPAVGAKPSRPAPDGSPGAAGTARSRK